ncbi:putative ATP synthase YscN [compost metagenome]
MLLQIGEYQKGQDPVADQAIARIEVIRQWLKQGTHEPSSLEQALATLETLTR